MQIMLLAKGRSTFLFYHIQTFLSIFSRTQKTFSSLCTILTFHFYEIFHLVFSSQLWYD